MKHLRCLAGSVLALTATIVSASEVRYVEPIFHPAPSAQDSAKVSAGESHAAPKRQRGASAEPTTILVHLSATLDPAGTLRMICGGADAQDFQATALQSRIAKETEQ